MPTLHLTSGTFADLVACFLLDKLTNPDEVVNIAINEDFDDLSVILQHKGIRSILLRYYMNVDPNFRAQYRMIRNVFTDNDQTPSVFLYVEKQHIPQKKVSVFKKLRKFLKNVVTLGMMDTGFKK